MLFWHQYDKFSCLYRVSNELARLMRHTSKDSWSWCVVKSRQPSARAQWAIHWESSELAKQQTRLEHHLKTFSRDQCTSTLFPLREPWMFTPIQLIPLPTAFCNGGFQNVF